MMYTLASPSLKDCKAILVTIACWEGGQSNINHILKCFMHSFLDTFWEFTNPTSPHPQPLSATPHPGRKFAPQAGKKTMVRSPKHVARLKAEAHSFLFFTPLEKEHNFPNLPFLGFHVNFPGCSLFFFPVFKFHFQFFPRESSSL